MGTKKAVGTVMSTAVIRGEELRKRYEGEFFLFQSTGRAIADRV
jgi:hypothetical protein